MADSKRKTANLFDKSAILNGYEIIDNQIVANSAWGVSDYIPVEQGKYYVATNTGSPVLEYETIGGTAVRSAKSITTGGYTPSETARFIRINFQLVKLDTIMLNKGSTSLPYEPYWQHSLRKLGTSTDTLTTLPADIYANDNNATVGLKGNMVQSSQPSPTTPIQPQECGERTGNLLDRSTEQTGYFVKSDGTLQGSSPTWIASDYVEIEENTQYTFNPNSTAGNAAKHCFYNENKQPFVSAVIDSGQQTFTTPTGAKYVRFSYRTSSSNVMLNLGSTALPFEPHGIKIPISSANTTTPVYLGEVETTRKIEKLVIDGTELWQFSSSDSNRTVCYINQSMSNVVGYCSHILWKSSYESSDYNRIVYLSSQGGLLYISLDNALLAGQTLQDFKAYLAQQYSAGTPVTVWYVLATEATGIVNEPLRKIGDYADTVSGITIPTITGKDSFDVLTTLKPSEVSIAYTGWHDASVKEWDGSEWQ